MASFYGYVILVIGLSLLLGMAGVDTVTNGLIDSFTPINSTSPTTNMTVDTSHFHGGLGGSTLLISLFAIILTFVALVTFRSGLGGIFGIGESVKIVLLAGFLPIMLSDMISIMNYLNGVNFMGGVIKYVSFVVYIPIAIGMIVSATDFIGGGR
jgi:hypothetical protein